MPNQIISLAYERYCLLLVWLDAHFTRAKSAGSAFEDTFNAFEFACKNQREGLLTHQRRVDEATSHFSKDELPLLRPVAFVPLGRADLMAAVIVDSIDECQNLMATVDRTIEEATMAFCLQPAKLCSGGYERRILAPHLTDVKSLLEQPLSPERPLIALIRLKLEGLPLLLDPILSQTEAVGFCLKRIAIAWQALCSSSGQPALGGIIQPSDLTPDSWQVSVLDLQEEEEIGLLFTCRNLSVPATLIGALRGVTLGELSEYSPQFRQMLSRGPACLLQKESEANFKKEHPEVLTEWTMGASHLFRWSRASVAINLDSYKNGAEGVSGWSASLATVNRPPGHYLDGMQIIRHAEGKDTLDHTVNGGIDKDFPPIWRSVFLGNIDMLAGSIIDSGETSTLPAQAYVSTKVIFQNVASLCRTMQMPEEVGSVLARWPTRHITSWSTVLAVPTPGSLLDESGENIDTEYRHVGGKHFPFLLAAIRHLPEKLFVLPSAADAATTCFLEDGGFIERLREAFGFLGLPMTLRRAYFVLFQRYISLAKDPMRYDSVLDLHDVMHTLWHVLVAHLPSSIWPELSQKNAAAGFSPSLNRRLTTQSVEFLSDLARAIESAIDLRLRRTLPDSGDHEWDLDYRGSLNQIVIAGETVLRAALGIVRRNVLGDESRYDRLGVVNRLTITSNITSVIAGLGVEDKARLAYTDTDVSHLSHMVQLTDYFHEAFHLIHHEMRTPVSLSDAKLEQPNYVAKDIRGTLAGLRDTLKSDNESTDRFVEMSGEIFVAMMMLLTIADGDIDLMWHQQTQAFATSPASALSPTDEGSAVTSYEAIVDLYDRFGRVFIPLGILTCLVQSSLNDENKLDFEKAFSTAGEGLDFMMPSKALCLFETRCRAILCLLPEQYPVKIPDEEARLDEAKMLGFQRWACEVGRHFDECWADLSSNGALDQMWAGAVEVVKCLINQSVGTTEPLPDHQLVNRWRSLISNADRRIDSWTHGNSESPISVTEIFETFGDPEWKNHVLGTVFIMRGLNWVWRENLPDPRQKNIEWRLPRGFKRVVQIAGAERGYVKPKVTLGGMEPFINWDNSKQYADQLIDPVRSEGFCLRKSARSRRLLHQAVFLKTLWGLSSVIRRRRLESMLEQLHANDTY